MKPYWPKSARLSLKIATLQLFSGLFLCPVNALRGNYCLESIKSNATSICFAISISLFRIICLRKSSDLYLDPICIRHVRYMYHYYCNFYIISHYIAENLLNLPWY